MNNRQSKQQAKLAIICDQICQATQHFLDATKRKTCFSYLFKQVSKEKEIATAVQDIVEKAVARMAFTPLTHFEESQLLDELNQYYKTLHELFIQGIHKKRMSIHFYQFFSSIQSGIIDAVKILLPHIRACPHFSLSQIKVQAIKTIALKFLANFSNRVAMLRKCFNFANKFSTKCLILYKCLSNSGLLLLLLERRGIIGLIPFFLAHSRISSES